MKIPDFDVFQISYSALGRRHERLIQDVADAGRRCHHSRRNRQGPSRRGVAQVGAGRTRRPARAGWIVTLSSCGSPSPHPACQTNIVGTADLNHFKANVAAAKAGPLPQAVYEEAKERLAQIGEAPADSQGE